MGPEHAARLAAGGAGGVGGGADSDAGRDARCARDGRSDASRAGGAADDRERGLREGRKIQLCAVRLLAKGVVVVGATVLKIKVQADELPPEAVILPVELPGPDQSRVERAISPQALSSPGCRARRPRPFRLARPGAIWYRVDRPIVEGASRFAGDAGDGGGGFLQRHLGRAGFSRNGRFSTPISP